MLVNARQMFVRSMEGGLTDVGKCYGRKVDRCW